VDRYRELRRGQPDKYDFSVNELNSMGYEILRRGDTAGAVEILKLNASNSRATGTSTTPWVRLC
jgi:hypothetical protein